MKKLFVVVVLGSFVLVGCDKPASSSAGSKKPMTAGPAVDKAKEDSMSKGMDATKKKEEDSKKAADPKAEAPKVDPKADPKK